MKEKKTIKLQSLVTETQYVNLNKMLFWDGVNETTTTRSLSKYINEILQKEMDSRPSEDFESTKNLRKTKR